MGPPARLQALSLRFQDGAAETAFIAQYREAMLPSTRASLVVAGVIYALLGGVDQALFPQATGELWTVRYGIVCPVVGLSVAISYTRAFVRLAPLLLVGATLVLGCGVLSMVVIAGPPLNHLYYAGLIVVILLACTLMRLRFVQATLVCAALVVAYELVSLLAYPVPLEILFSNNLFLFSATAVGLSASYLLERYARLDFDLSRALAARALRDPLTGLYNRGYLDERLSETLQLHARYGYRFAVALIDIDDFKKVNDVHGHPAGDEYLRQVAAAIRESVRTSDIVFRYGGDELLVLFAGVDEQAARVAADRMLAQITTAATGAGPLPVSLSIGIAAVDALSPAELLGRADRALYEAKRTGKGRACLYGALQASAP